MNSLEKDIESMHYKLFEPELGKQNLMANNELIVRASARVYCLL